MDCFHCGRPIEVKERERVGFRDSCPTCDRPSHVCRNCDFYDPAYNNQCRENQAERVVAKDRANFCEYFTPGRENAKEIATKTNPRTKLDALFKKKP
jgi:hypothetical protein